MAHYDLLLGSCRSMFSGTSSCGTLRFSPWAWNPWRTLSSFSSISSCGTLRFALWTWISVRAGSKFNGNSFHFGFVGFHFLLFWPFPGQLLGPPPPHKLPKVVRFPNLPYKEFSSAETGSIFQFLAFWAFLSFHFGLVSLHVLSFWPCGPSFPFILALWAFISFHFGLVGLHFLTFWLFPGQLLGSPPPQVAKNAPFPNLPYKKFSSVETGSIFQFLAFWGLPFLSFWHYKPSCPFILALWAFISFHFGLVSLHFLSFWPCGRSNNNKHDNNISNHHRLLIVAT